jgi:very-short-patch-repair endonuclease
MHYSHFRGLIIVRPFSQATPVRHYAMMFSRDKASARSSTMAKSDVDVRLAHMLGRLEKRIQALLKLCESPIEQLLLLTFIEQYCIDGNGYIGPKSISWTDRWQAGRLGTDGSVLFCELHPQYVIHDRNISYRLDFAMFYDRVGGPGQIKVAIECDGHNFHERTAEQAQRDRAKDRYLQQTGWIIARYTGSEIARNAPSILDESQILHELSMLASTKDEELYNAARPEGPPLH